VTTSTQSMPFIESIQNPRIKSALELRESRSRRLRSEFLIEGRRELTRALDRDVNITEVFVGEEFASQHEVTKLLDRFSDSVRIAMVSTRVYEKLALREGTEGFVAVAKNQSWSLAQVFVQNAVLVIMDGLEKPGNIGAILRSVDGSGATGMLISSDSSVDIYNPNVIRASQGAVFSIPIHVLPPTDIAEALSANHIRSYALEPAATENYFDADLAGACAIIVGNEADGLSDHWRKSADNLIKIPMHGICDSLNASVSTAIVLYECARQQLRK
jgi:TrmH family RNA methyltransferase